MQGTSGCTKDGALLKLLHGSGYTIDIQVAVVMAIVCGCVGVVDLKGPRRRVKASQADSLACNAVPLPHGFWRSACRVLVAPACAI